MDKRPSKISKPDTALGILLASTFAAAALFGYPYLIGCVFVFGMDVHAHVHPAEFNLIDSNPRAVIALILLITHLTVSTLWANAVGRSTEIWLATAACSLPISVVPGWLTLMAAAPDGVKREAVLLIPAIGALELMAALWLICRRKKRNDPAHASSSAPSHPAAARKE